MVAYRASQKLATSDGASNSDQGGRHQARIPNWKRIPKKGDGIIRIMATNVGNIGAAGSEKERDMFQWFKHTEADTMIITEVGINWDKVQSGHRLQARCKKYLQRFVQSSSSLHDINANQRQWGGTAIIANGNISGRWTQTSNDPTKMGRWSSMRFQGKANTTFRIISIYIPSKSNKYAGSVYIQQATAMAMVNRTTDPIDALIDDIATNIETWKDAGEKIIIGGDINMDIHKSKWAKKMDELKLIEVTKTQNLKRRETHIRNSTNTPIDGIWTSININIINSHITGYGPWDHRSIIVDLREDDLIGKTSIATPKFRGRRLQTNRKAVKSRYITICKKEYNRMRLCELAIALDDEIGFDPLTPKQKKVIEHIDKCRTMAILKAEKGCRKIRMGNIPYSPKIGEIRREIEYWNLAMKRRAKKKVSRRYMERVKKKAGLGNTDVKNLTNEQLQEKLSLAKERYNELKKMAPELRSTFLEQDLTIYGEDEDGKERYRKEMKAREEIRESSRRIKYVLKKDNLGYIPILIDDTKDGPNEAQTDTEEIARMLCKVNKMKYMEANKSEIISTQESEWIGKDGTNVGAKMILDGDTSESKASDDLQKLSSAQKRHNKTTEWEKQKMYINVQDHCRAWKSAREKTASAPSGIHFGCWKANTEDIELATVDAIMRSIPMRTGYSLERWQQCVDMQLLKKPGIYRATKTRAIGLLEGDFNMNCKLLGKLARDHAEKNGTINDDQYGSRAHRTAPEVLINGTLISDIMQINGTEGAFEFNDAKGCFDRMIHQVVSVGMQRQGVPIQPIKSVLHTLQQMTHRIRTATGVSKAKYGGKNKSQEFQGMKQGLGVAPTAWLFISSALMDHMKNSRYGFKYADPLQEEPDITISCLAYVDDSNVIHTFSQQGIAASEQIKEFQSAVNEWETLIRMTGGALEPAKSHWYIVKFTWHKDRWIYSKSQKDELRIKMKGPDTNDLIDVERITVKEPKRSLGMIQSHDGNQKAMTEFLHEKSIKWAEKIRCGHITADDALVALKTTIWPTLSYALAITCINKNKLEQIMSPAICAILSARRIARTVPRTMVHAPESMGGMGIKHLEEIQLTKHIQMIMSHMTRNTKTGKLLRAYIKSLEIWVGSQAIVWNSEEWHDHVPSSWWIETIKCAKRYNIKLEKTNKPWRKPRQGDKTIMDVIYNGNTSMETRWKANLARLKLGVLWMSDICKIQSQAPLYRCSDRHHHKSRQSYKNWPRIGKISEDCWAAWELTFNKEIIRQEYRNIIISLRLGEWNIPPKTNFFICTNGDLWRFQDERAKRYTVNGRRKQCQETNTVGTPTVQRYVEVISEDDRIRIDQIFDYKATMGRLTWHACTDQMGGSTTQLLEKLVMPQGVEKALEVIASGNAVACTDGSVKDGKGTAAFVCADVNNPYKHVMRCGTKVPKGHKMTSTRAELMGILLIYRAAEALRKWSGITPIIYAACDSTSALRRAVIEDTASPNTIDYDIIKEISECREGENKIEWCHVYGHADERKPSETWTVHEVLNIAADNLAHAQHHGGNEFKGSITRKGIIVTRDETIMSHIAYESLCEPMATERARTYLSNKFKINIDQVDWLAFEKANKCLNRTQRHGMFKLMVGFAATGENMHRRRRVISKSCPRCGEVESNTHIISCPSKSSRRIWKQTIGSIRRRMAMDKIPEDVVEMACTNIEAASRGFPPRGGIVGTHRTLNIFRNQTTCSWDGLLWGMWSKTWEDSTEILTDTPKEWLHKVIARIWKGIKEQWDDRNKTAMEQGGLDYDSAKPLLEEMIKEIEEVEESAIPPSMRQLWRNGPSHRANQYLWIQTMLRILPHIKDNTDQRLLRWIQDTRHK